MKKVFLLITMAIILQSCATSPIYYHSEAKLSYYSIANQTNFKLIKNEKSDDEFDFAVIAAKDNDTLSYILLTPTTEAPKKYKLTDAKLDYPSFLLPNKVQEFIKILNASAINWSKKYSDTTGIVYEFVVAPENHNTRLCEDNTDWIPMLDYHFQNNNNGPLGTLRLGCKRYSFIYKIKNLDEVNSLADLLTKALKD